MKQSASQSTLRFCIIGGLTLFVAPMPARAATEANLVTRSSVGSVQDIAALLPLVPRGFAPSCADRSAWNAPEVQRRIAPFVARARKMALHDMPPWSDDAYLEFSRNGQRTDGQDMMAARQTRLVTLVIAECGEGDGRYLAAIEAMLDALAAQPAWTLAAHDLNLENFSGTRHTVDLNAAMLGASIAETLSLLQEQISPAVRARALAALERHVFGPMRLAFANGPEANPGSAWWLDSRYNWNAVCLDGVTSAALAVLPDRNDRARFIAAAQHYITNYISGMGEDGYSSEGPHYWSYGLLPFFQLRETLMKASDDRIDLLSLSPRVGLFSHYGFAIQMPGGAVAPFGDSHLDRFEGGYALAYANHAYKLGRQDKLSDVTLSPDAPLAELLHPLFDQPRNADAGRELPPSIDPLRTFFPAAGVLVSRPATAQTGQLAITIKAGGNSISHSHDDSGSYAIAIDGTQPTGDPGMGSYTARTFGPDRRTIKTVNSLGHPVPLVDGERQRDASVVSGQVMFTQFTRRADRIGINLAPSYAVPGLRKLTRHMTFDRTANSVALRDTFSASRPILFETALIGETWGLRAPGLIELRRDGRCLLASITSSTTFTLVPSLISEDGLSFTRVAIRLKGRHRNGSVSVRFTAASTTCSARPHQDLRGHRS